MLLKFEVQAYFILLNDKCYLGIKYGSLLFPAWQFYQKSDSNSSRKLFRFSLIHLPALMILMLVNKKNWYKSGNQEQDTQKVQDVKIPDSRISVLPRRPVVAAQESDTDL